MLKLEDLIEKMKTHFPKWMDIRRKIKSSSGGLYLNSIAESIVDIQKAIEDYKKDFFIDSYINKEDDILAFLYKINIGTVDVNDIKLIIPLFEITDNEEIFYNNENKAYFKDGFLYFKENLEKIIYSINDFKYEDILTKMHVWNIYDEFAIFVGLRRYENETNKELLNRILELSRNKINSTELGLKNAIKADLINITPELNIEDIKIERPTPENLNKYYDKFETILDHLSKINKDTYKEKRWDIDTWNFNVKSIDYIPHAWDILLNQYTNGIGFKEDLKVEIIESESKTDVTFYFYKKQLETLNNYIKNHNIRKNFVFKLKKYNDEIDSIKVKYKITASNVEKINPLNISIKAIENKTGKFLINVQDIIVENNNKSIIEKDFSLIDNNFNYKIDFLPKNEIGDFRIDYCKQIKGDNFNDLLNKNYPGFKVNGEGLISAASKKYVEDLYQLSSYDNIRKTINGIELLDLSKEGKLKINLNECQSSQINYEYEVKETSLDLNNFNKTNCYILNNTIVSDTVNEEKTVTINLIANTFSAIIEGPYKIKYSIDNSEDIVLLDKDNKIFNFEIAKSNSPQNIKLKITFLKEDCKLKKCKYSKYDFKITTEKGELINSNNILYIPTYDSNNLLIEIRSFSGFSPILKYVYIGTKLKNEHGYFDIEFNPENGEKIYTKFENCIMCLKKYDKITNKLIDTINDYKPYKEYTAKEDTKLELNIDNYLISKIEANNINIETININDTNKKYIINLKKNQSILDLYIYGKSNNPIMNQSLAYILEKKDIKIKDFNFYVAKNENSIIAKNKINEDIKYIKIYKKDLFNGITSNNVQIEILNEKINCKFIENESIIKYSNEINSSFDFISFEPKEGNIHTTINEYNLALTYIDNIPIVNTFNNDYDINSKKTMFYTIESLNKNVEVKFNTFNIFEKCEEKTLDRKTICLKLKNTSNINCKYESNSIEMELLLGSNISIPTHLNDKNENIFDIRRYIIESEHDINYSNKYNDSDNNLDYVFSEFLYINHSKINKLKYSNINEIEKIMHDNKELKKDFDYILLEKEGILIWINEELKEKSYIEITYNINIAKSINVNMEYLYKEIKYPVTSLNLINTITMNEVNINNLIDLNSYEEYKNCDMISIKYEKSGFLSEIKNGILKIINNVPENSIAIKTGYFYLDGKEYYLFSDEKYDSINKTDSIQCHNVIKENNSFILKQKSENYITNSSFDLNVEGEIFNLDCLNKNKKGVSILNKITTCDNFNNWNTFGTSLSISNGYNGQGLCFNSFYEDKGYCYISLNEHLINDEEYFLSFYLKGNGIAYLGKERNINSDSIEFNYHSLIDIIDVISTSKIIDDIFEINFIKEKNEKYFLILTGSGTIDDIILSNKNDYSIYNHIKNIDLLNFDIKENIYSQYSTRLFVTDKNGAILDGTEINENNEIINSSYINWGYTKIKEVNSYLDFKKCILESVDLIQFNNKCIIKTGINKGKISTMPIYVGNTKVIKNLLYKINDVLFDNMKGFKIRLLTSNNKDTGYKEIIISSENMNSVNGLNLMPYIKLIIEIPENKVINNIEFFIEYLSDKNNAPLEMEVTNGSYTSKILDAQYNERYLIKNIDIETMSLSNNNYIFQIRASKENDEKTVWTQWKEILIDENNNISNRITFLDYRYFQFRVLLKGENASIKINNIDLEVI